MARDEENALVLASLTFSSHTNIFLAISNNNACPPDIAFGNDSLSISAAADGGGVVDVGGGGVTLFWPPAPKAR